MTYASAIDQLSTLAGIEIVTTHSGWVVVGTEGCDIHADFLTDDDKLQSGIHELPASPENPWQQILQSTPPEFGTDFAVVDGSREEAMEDLRNAVREDLEFYVVLAPSANMTAALRAWLEPFGEHCPILCITIPA